MGTANWRTVVIGGALAGVLVWPSQVAAQQATSPAPTQTQDAPTAIGPPLAAPQSEMRLVAQHYRLDRNTLNGNYLAGGRGRGGNEAAPAVRPNTSVSLSPNRIARLKRFDLDWQAALQAIDAARLTQDAQTELAALKQSVADNSTAPEPKASDR